MNANTRPEGPKAADILNLNDFRATERTAGTTTSLAYAQRIALVKTRVINRLEHQLSPAVAVAAAFLDADGQLGITAAGIEPEMAAALSDELRRLASILDAHSHKPAAKRRREGGFAALAFVSLIGFACATYLNEVAWIDAALSLSAQLVASLLSRRQPD